MTTDQQIATDRFASTRRAFNAGGHGANVRILGTAPLTPKHRDWADLTATFRPEHVRPGGFGLVMCDALLSCGIAIVDFAQLGNINADISAGRPANLGSPQYYLYHSSLVSDAWERLLGSMFRPWHPNGEGVIAESRQRVVVYEFTKAGAPGVAWHCRVCHADPRYGGYVYNSPMLRLYAADDALAHLRRGHNLDHPTQLLVNRPCTTCDAIDAAEPRRTNTERLPRGTQ